MSSVIDLMPKPPNQGYGIIIGRPRSIDAIGAALDCAFALKPGLPSGLAAALNKLNAIG